MENYAMPQAQVRNPGFESWDGRSTPQRVAIMPNGQRVVIINNANPQQSTIKGLLWGIVGLEFTADSLVSAAACGVSLGAGIASASIPIVGALTTPTFLMAAAVSGVAACAFGTLASYCLKNAVWHFRAPEQHVIITA